MKILNACVRRCPSLYYTKFVRYSHYEDTPEYKVCSVHNTRRLVKYLQQNTPGIWSCREKVQCLPKGVGIGHRPAGATYMGICSIHNRRRLWPSKLQFNKEKSQWECRPEDPCQDKKRN